MTAASARSQTLLSQLTTDIMDSADADAGAQREPEDT